MSTEHSASYCISYHADPEATAHDLMNEATEWLQFARSLTRLLGDLLHEADTVDCQRVAHGLEGIGALMRMGLQCAAQAHVRMCWEQSCKDQPGPADPADDLGDVGGRVGD